MSFYVGLADCTLLNGKHAYSPHASRNCRVQIRTDPKHDEAVVEPYQHMLDTSRTAIMRVMIKTPYMKLSSPLLEIPCEPWSKLLVYSLKALFMRTVDNLYIIP